MWVGCGALVPAKLPPQLENTPGAPATITDRHFSTAAFSLVYPDGWIVITSPANTMPWGVFISPDETAVIVVSVEPLDPLPQPPVLLEGIALREETRTVALGEDTRVIVSLIAPETTWDSHYRHLERLADTLAAPGG